MLQEDTTEHRDGYRFIASVQNMVFFGKNIKILFTPSDLINVTLTNVTFADRMFITVSIQMIKCAERQCCSDDDGGRSVWTSLSLIFVTDVAGFVWLESTFKSCSQPAEAKAKKIKFSLTIVAYFFSNSSLILIALLLASFGVNRPLI